MRSVPTLKRGKLTKCKGIEAPRGGETTKTRAMRAIG